MLSSTDLSLVPSPLPDDLFNQAFNQQMGYAASSQKARIEQEPCFTDNTIYSAVYSGVPVFEMICRNVAVMRRRSDSYLNATQILKVAGIDKGKRTKILEKEILNGLHEKVQGGYGKYQGTWIPYERGVQLAHQYNVHQQLLSILDFDPPTPGAKPTFNKRECTPKTSAHAAKKQKFTPAKSLKISELPLVTLPPAVYERPCPERYKPILLSLSNQNTDPLIVPEILTRPPPDLDVNLILDEYGNTALHLAAANARSPTVEALLVLKANTLAQNYNGETALVKVVLNTISYQLLNFTELCDALGPCVGITDTRSRSVFHHIALSATGTQQQRAAARYYLECLLERVAKDNGDFGIVDLKDHNGDTALNIAARIGCKNLVEQLVSVGANVWQENRAGLKPIDFGIESMISGGYGDEKVLAESCDNIHSEGMDFDCLNSGTVIVVSDDECPERFPAKKQLPVASGSYSARVVFPPCPPEDIPLTAFNSRRSPDLESRVERTRIQVNERLKGKGKEVAEVVQKMFEDLSYEYSSELRSKMDALTETQQQLRQSARELAKIRKTNAVIRGENQKIPQLMQEIETLENRLEQEIQARLSNTDGSSDAHVELALRKELELLKKTSAETIEKYQKLIACCAGIPDSSVGGMMDSLLAAVESDESSTICVTQMAAFMSRVKQIEESGN